MTDTVFLLLDGQCDYEPSSDALLVIQIGEIFQISNQIVVKARELRRGLTRTLIVMSQNLRH